MKTFFGGLIGLVFSVGFISCQREVDGTLPGRPADSSAVIQPMMKIVEKDISSGDSSIKTLQTILEGGQKTILLTQVYSYDQTDTFYTRFTYDGQNQLSTIKITESAHPTPDYAKYVLSWTSGRLTRIVCDTSGNFSSSYDFIYTSTGSNTLISAVRTPSYHSLDPTFQYIDTFRMVVNNSFAPLSNESNTHITYTPIGGTPEIYHYININKCNFSANNLIVDTFYFSRFDTTGPGGSVINIIRDTSTHAYSRSASGVNLADSLKKIFGTYIYTMANYGLFDFDISLDILNELDFTKYVYAGPFSSLLLSNRHWENGIFNPNTSSTNKPYKKNDNTFDALGRIINIKVYDDFSTTTLNTTFKITYP